jgi:hypothetical protein
MTEAKEKKAPAKKDAGQIADEAEAASKPEAKPAKMPEAEKGKAWYVNKSTFNVYTEGGRCMPEQTVQLTPEEAKQYKGLEPCQ